jgi:hypothetical protein
MDTTRNQSSKLKPEKVMAFLGSIRNVGAALRAAPTFHGLIFIWLTSLKVDIRHVVAR